MRGASTIYNSTATATSLMLRLFANSLRRPLLGRTRLQKGVFVLAAASSYTYIYAMSQREPMTRAEPSSTTTSGGGSDRLQIWRDKWKGGKDPRWHKNEVHPSLQQYLGEKILDDDFPTGGARILVPLCGKSVDMNYLAAQRKVAEVVGVDGIRQAMEDFAAEHPDLEVQSTGETTTSGFERWKGHSITLLTGDFFDLDVETAGGTFEAVWDHGALVAVQPDLRKAYIDKLGELVCRPGGRILLSTYVRPNGDTTTGPPFSIDEGEVRRLFEGQPWVESVELLDEHSALAREVWYKAIVLYLTMGNVPENIFFIRTK